jgi:hypothetical protein
MELKRKTALVMGSNEITINPMDPTPIAYIALDEAIDAARNEKACRKRKKLGVYNVAELIAFICWENARCSATVYSCFQN